MVSKQDLDLCKYEIGLRSDCFLRQTQRLPSQKERILEGESLRIFCLMKSFYLPNGKWKKQCCTCWKMSPSLARYPCPTPTYFLVVLHIDDEVGWFSKRLKPFNHAKIDLDAVTQAGHFPRRVYFCYLLLPFLLLCLCPFAEQMPCA